MQIQITLGGTHYVVWESHVASKCILCTHGSVHKLKNKYTYIFINIYLIGFDTNFCITNL